ncbi:AraC family transcriptional regulator [Albibacterium bauzanense]|uniref:AraC family transcriptional regulator n=1 Tax=Albibacterium bauzanense TaxID=653929 RepID=A0A4R1M3W3_9SPHI|nr:AraC family transcriptional regulator [Albibacterium bauzanense]TCK85564.1 AraC family transcriptional regulator [Albibacterium bauzanense]
MKASVEILYPKSDQSFLVRKFDKSAFEAPYHYHSEFELTTIIKGRGKRYIGNHMEDFQEGDLVLLGAGLPHCWKLENTPNSENEEASAVVVQFTRDFLGTDFFDKVELTGIKKLLEESRYGIRFSEEISTKVQKQLISLSKPNNHFKSLMRLMTILHDLESSDNQIILDKHITSALDSVEQARINPVMAYIVDNFNDKISLDKAAEIAHMTPNAFCKFFKKVTRKTFVQMVLAYRLNYARQKLIQTDKPISEISFESGFGDVSHFYKMFKAETKLSPLNYRKKFMQRFS